MTQRCWGEVNRASTPTAYIAVRLRDDGGLYGTAFSLVGASSSRADHLRLVVERVLIGEANVGTKHWQGFGGCPQRQARVSAWLSKKSAP